MSTDRGITDTDRERIAAFLDTDGPGQAWALAGSGVTPDEADADPEYGEATAALAASLRERLAVGEELVTTSHALGQRTGRSPMSLSRSFVTLADTDPPGLVVTRAAASDGRNAVQWRIEREDARR
jgi:uncharacterized protein YdiU (UPF0061 family)